MVSGRAHDYSTHKIAGRLSSEQAFVVVAALQNGSLNAQMFDAPQTFEHEYTATPHKPNELKGMRVEQKKRKKTG